MKDRKILHIDMDAFFASVEQAINPRLMGKPLIVAGRADKRRSVVCAASYEAKNMGIDSGMSTYDALRICPYAEFVTADSSKYIYVSKKIYNLLYSYSPQVEQASVDEFYMDVTGLDKKYGSYFDLGMDIKNNIQSNFKITGSIGISINRIMSKIASKLKKPDGMIIMDKEDIYCFLKDLPVEKIPGIGKSLKAKLNGYSIFKYSHMCKFSEDFYLSKFGKVGLWMFSLVNPLLFDEQEIEWFNQEKQQPKSVGHSYTLPYNIYIRNEVEAWIRFLCEMVGFRLRKKNLQSRIMHISLRKPDFGFISKEKNFKELTCDTNRLFKRAIYILDNIRNKNMFIRAIGITAKGLSGDTTKGLFADYNKRINLANTKDRINGKFGDWTLYPASLLFLKK